MCRKPTVLLLLMGLGLLCHPALTSASYWYAAPAGLGGAAGNDAKGPYALDLGAGATYTHATTTLSQAGLGAKVAEGDTIYLYDAGSGEYGWYTVGTVTETTAIVTLAHGTGLTTDRTVTSSTGPKLTVAQAAALITGSDTIWLLGTGTNDFSEAAVTLGAGMAGFTVTIDKYTEAIPQWSVNAATAYVLQITAATGTVVLGEIELAKGSGTTSLIYHNSADCNLTCNGTVFNAQTGLTYGMRGITKGASLRVCRFLDCTFTCASGTFEYPIYMYEGACEVSGCTFGALCVRGVYLQSGLLWADVHDNALAAAPSNTLVIVKEEATGGLIRIRDNTGTVPRLVQQLLGSNGVTAVSFDIAGNAIARSAAIGELIGLGTDSQARAEARDKQLGKIRIRSNTFSVAVGATPKHLVFLGFDVTNAVITDNVMIGTESDNAANYVLVVKCRNAHVEGNYLWGARPLDLVDAWHSVVRHNTIVGAYADVATVEEEDQWTGGVGNPTDFNEITDNIIYQMAGGAGVPFVAASETSIVDRNLYYREDAGNLATVGGTGCSDLAAMRSRWAVFALGAAGELNDANSVSGNPLFVNVSGVVTDDWRVARKSPAVLSTGQVLGAAPRRDLATVPGPWTWPFR